MVKSLIPCTLLLFSMSATAFNLPIQNLFVSMVERSGMPANEVTIDQALQRVAIKMNQYLPSEVDKETRLDKMTAETGRQLTYHYTLITMKSNDVNKAKFKNAMEPVLKRRLCASDEMKTFLRHGVNIVYVYRAADIQPVASFKYLPADCGYKK
ncbi:hypothetical protein Q8A64_13910 [Oxalobacteraceae bacterium R-40]|uniref:Uncharacterized protein n=1 Tax=Keguizhuia sedimenti TaxID=3064264 RepID=A0ABU1BRM3_9BURK|nr:hypothetical protein [Oxalobacteraceae bacterium R-40]